MNPRNNSASQDLIAILRADTFEQVLVGAGVMQVSVRETSQLPSYATERGDQITDHRVFDPVEIELPLILTQNSRNVYDELRQLWHDLVPLIIQTRVASYNDMIILEMPHTEDGSTAIPAPIRFRRVTKFTPEYGDLPPRKVANPSQTDTVEGGSKQTQEADANSSSALYRILN